MLIILDTEIVGVENQTRVQYEEISCENDTATRATPVNTEQRHYNEGNQTGLAFNYF